MNQANVDLIRRHLHLEETGQYDAVLADMTDPPEYYIPGRSDEPLTTREGVSSIHHMLYEALEGISIDVVTIDANDEFGFAEVVTSGVHVREFRGIPLPAGRFSCRVAGSFSSVTARSGVSQSTLTAPSSCASLAGPQN
jgi:hypothetical protein